MKPLKVKRKTQDVPPTPAVEINSVQFFDIYRIVFSEFQKIRPEAKSVKNLSLLKKLLSEQGQVIAVQYIIDAIKNWDKYRNAVKPPIVGYPTIPVLWGFRNTFLAVMNQQSALRKNSVEYTDSPANKNSDSKKLFLGE